MKCITFENNGKLSFERESGILRIIPEDYAKENPDEVMVWTKDPDKQMEYLVDSAHKKDIHIEKVEFTENEEVDLRTAKSVDVKDIPFLRDYYLAKYQKEVNKYQGLLKDLK